MCMYTSEINLRVVLRNIEDNTFEPKKVLILVLQNRIDFYINNNTVIMAIKNKNGRGETSTMIKSCVINIKGKFKT